MSNRADSGHSTRYLTRNLTTDLNRAQAALSAAVDDTEGGTPCRQADAWTDARQLSAATLAAVAGCHRCPVLGACRTVADRMPRGDLALTVTAGRVFNRDGREIRLNARQEARVQAIEDAADLADRVATRAGQRSQGRAA